MTVSITGTGHNWRASMSDQYDFVCMVCGTTDEWSGAKEPCQGDPTKKSQIKATHGQLVIEWPANPKVGDIFTYVDPIGGASVNTWVYKTSFVGDYWEFVGNN